MTVFYRTAARPHHRRALRTAVRFGVVLSAFAPGLAWAEEVADANSDKIIVTGLKDNQTGSGTKTDTPLMATAQSITIIDNDELIRRNALSINQALGYVAGVSPTSAVAWSHAMTN